MTPTLRRRTRTRFPEIQTGYELNSEGWFSAVIPTGRENILDNPSFEKSSNGAVTVGGTIARSADFQSHGAISLKVTPTAGVNDGFYFDNTTHALKVLENTLYWPSFDFKGGGGSKFKAYMARQFSGTQLGTAYQFAATGNPQRIEFPYQEGDNSLVDSLTAYWKLGEATGATRLDSVGTNHLTPTGGANPGPSQTTGIINNGAQFTAANSEYLIVADTAALSVADVDFSVSLWVRLDTKATTQGIFAKAAAADTVAALEYRLLYNTATDRFNWLVSNGVAATTVVANALGAVSVATWYHIVVWHDSVNNVIGIRVNDTAQDTAAHTVGCQDGAGAFKIGTTGAIMNFLNGKVDEVGFWKKVLSTAERTQLYNGGFGDTYNFLYRRLYVVKDNETNTRPFYVDGLQLEAGDFPTTAIDGDMRGLIPNFVDYYWTGAPHASTSVRVANSADGGRVINLSRLGFRIISVLGLGLGGLNPVMTPLGNGGEFYQGTSITGRDFTLVGEIGNDQLSLDVARQALEDAFGPNRISPQQPIKLRYEPLDECGNSLGRTLEIPCVFKSGMELQRDNLERERLALTFRLYLPFAANDANDQGTPLSYQEAVTANRFIWRDGDGNWFGEDLSDSVLAMIVLPDGTWALGGNFTNAGSIADADFLVRYDPSTRTFSAFNATPLGGNVTSMELLPDGNLVIGGNFTNAGGDANADFLCKLNLSTGVFSSFNATPLNSSVSAIKLMNDGNLAIGGTFANAGGDANADFLAKVTVSTGAFSSFNATPLSAYVRSLAVDKSGNLVIGGGFANAGGDANADFICKMVGTVFTALTASNPLNGEVTDIEIMDNGDYLITGQFTNAGGDANADYAARYSVSAFYALGTGLDAQGFSISRIGLAEYVFGGSFTTAGSITFADKNAIWTGSSWVPVDIDFALNPAVLFSIFSLSRIALGFNDAGTQIVGSSSLIVNSGSDIAYPRFTFKGPSRIISLKNMSNGASVYFNLLLMQNEEVILTFSSSSISFTSNLRGNIASSILPGSSIFKLEKGDNQVSVFMTYTANELNDGGNQLSAYSLQGVTTLNSDDGRLYINIVDAGGGFRRIDIYQDSARTLLVAQTSATYNGTGVKTIVEQNSSGITGTITVGAVGAADSDITIDVPVVSIIWNPTFTSLSGAVLPRLF